MAKSTISNKIDGVGAGVVVTATLYPIIPTPAFSTDDSSEVDAVVTTTTDSGGNWSLILDRNSDIVPYTTYWQVQETIPLSGGGFNKRVSQIGVGPSNQTLLAALITPTTTPQLLYLTQAAADARYEPITVSSPQTAHYIFAGPASGSPATPTFRAAVAGDIPTQLNVTSFGGALPTGVTVAVPIAPTATANYGLVSIGAGPFDGTTSGFFAGSPNGAHIAINAASGYMGRMVDAQVAGVRMFAVGKGTVVSATSAILQSIEFPAFTTTITGSTTITTATGFNYAYFGIPTYSAASAVAITIGATVAIAGAPTVAGSATLANPLALWVQNGGVAFGSTVTTGLAFQIQQATAEIYLNSTTVTNPTYVQMTTNAGGGSVFYGIEGTTPALGGRANTAVTNTNLGWDFIVSGQNRLQITVLGTFAIPGYAVAGGVSTLTITPGAHTAVTTNVIPGLNLAAHSLTISADTTPMYANYLGVPTLLGSAATKTAANFYTLWIGAPIASTNAAITHPWSLGLGGNLYSGGPATINGATATTSGGAVGLVFGTTAGFGVYYGSGAPTISAAQGSLYLRSDGTSVTRAYINTDGSTTWTALVSVG